MPLTPPTEDARTLEKLVPKYTELYVFPALVEFSAHPDVHVIVRFASEPGEVSWNIKDAVVLGHDELMQLRGRAIDYVSDVEERLDKVLIDYFSSNQSMAGLLDEVGIQATDLGSISKLDFMSCKTLLSQMLKKDKRLGGKRGYTKLLDDIVLERNKYAHGRFYFLSPENTPLIQWLDKNGTVCYAEVSNQVMFDFTIACLEVFCWLDYLEEQFTGHPVERTRVTVGRSPAPRSE